MPSLFKRGKYYHIKFIQDGKEIRQSTNCRSKAEANLYLRSFDPKIKSAIRLDTLRREALQYSKRLNKAMQWQYKQTLDRFFSFTGNKLLIEISKTTIDNFIADLKTLKTIHGKPYSAPSINMNIAVLKRCFQLAVDNEWIAVNPVRIKKVKVPRTRPAFTVPEALTLLEALKDTPYYQVIRMAFNTGIRRTALCNLEWKDIDLEKGMIYTKNKIDKHTQFVPINPVAREILLDRLKIADISGKVFDVNAGYLTKVIKKYIKKLGLDNKLTFHSTRHTFGTQIAKDFGLLMASKMLNHEDIKTTMTYVDVSIEELKEKIQGFGV